MLKKFLSVFMVLGLVVLFAVQLEARTVVTVSVEDGPVFTETDLETVDLFVPERPAAALPLNEGDKVFFSSFDPLMEGEGTITVIYEIDESTVDESTITEAIILDHVTR